MFTYKVTYLFKSVQVNCYSMEEALYKGCEALGITNMELGKEITIMRL